MTKKLFIGLYFLFAAAIVFFCVFYLSSGYDALVKWYVGLNGCFYNSDTWAGNFFTPGIKHDGNSYCALALLVVLAGSFFLLKRLRKASTLHEQRPAPALGASDIVPIGICLLAACVFWYWGHGLVALTNDEAFSAVNCADAHPFQTMSYYMLPNNHIFFNLLNNLLFHPFKNKVATGKLISLACYMALIPLFYTWLKSTIQNKFVAVLATVTLSLQFPVWAFGFEARGYEVVALCSWVVFVALFKYQATRQQKWLGIYVAACAAGYFTMPTFLYLHAACMVFGLIRQLAERKPDMLFWKYQAACVAAVFLLYLPCLCFSGLESITGNQYVNLGHSLKELFADFVPTCQNYLLYCFSNFITKNYVVDAILFLTPLLLFFYRKNKLARSLAWFYVAMWVTILLISLKIKVYPLDRSLPGQFSITLAIVIYTIYLLIGSLSKKINGRFLPQAALALLLVMLSVNYIKENKDNSGHYICHFPANGWYAVVFTEGVKLIPAGSTVGVSNNGYFWYCVLLKHGYRVSRCTPANEDFYLKCEADPKPPGLDEHYVELKNVVGVGIYKRK